MLIDFLNKEFKKRQNKNKAYSMRAFAKSLKMDSSTLTQILSGKRKLSFVTAKKIVQLLSLDKATQNILLLSYDDFNKKFLCEEDFFVPNEELSAELMSHWEYYTVLSYLEINCYYDVKKIAEDIGTTPEIVQSIIENLLTLNIIKLEKNKLKITGKQLTAPRTFNSKSLSKVHQENIQKALDIFLDPSVKLKDFSGITIAMSSKKFFEAQEMIKTFRRSLGEFLRENDEKEDSVYRLNIQLFPLYNKKQIS